MRRIVVDVSVALKWFFRERADEPDTAAALAVLRGIRADEFALLQPAHFVAEVAAVLAREMPDVALRRLRDLLDIEMTIVDDAMVYARAIELARKHGHHLVDTLYHAVALETSSLLITADERYARKARDREHLVRLGEFAASGH